MTCFSALYHIFELVFLVLFQSEKVLSPVAFDEDFEAELADNHDARTEVSLLAKSPDPELTEVSRTFYQFHYLV